MQHSSLILNIVKIPGQIVKLTAEALNSILSILEVDYSRLRELYR